MAGLQAAGGICGNDRGSRFCEASFEWWGVDSSVLTEQGKGNV